MKFALLLVLTVATVLIYHTAEGKPRGKSHDKDSKEKQSSDDAEKQSPNSFDFSKKNGHSHHHHLDSGSKRTLEKDEAIQNKDLPKNEARN
jgi:ABC-type nickel/cobalt efflux system permease component RcnA